MHRSWLLIVPILLFAASAVPSQAADLSRSVAACPATGASAPDQALGQPAPLFTTALPCGCYPAGETCSDPGTPVDTCPGLFVGSACTYCGESGTCFGLFMGGRPTRCPSGTGYLCLCQPFAG
jgi:hypothetical protein